MSSNEQTRKLAEMLDRLCAEGSAHINVTADNGDEVTEHTENSADCRKGNTACSIPTLHKGLDGEE